MARLHQDGNITVRVYANDHLPPHFHVVTPNAEALVLIDGLTILRGEIDTATRRKVWGWVEANVAVIAAEWNRINPRFPIA
ncbi:DUF4160 domain-containing protein [Methylopila sp. 73B]|uniref:DUF4160 domain-containing protein n=1 Tax=Methylopila sp. 73B TaxID=1120792 RepID=UPI00035F8D9A|nr:DUF4160 domain-containing protein [Methylopila sp. 73B]